MNELYTLGNIFNAFLTIGLFFGGYIAIKSGRRKALNSIQVDSMAASEQTISALKERLDLLEKRLDEVVKENSALRQIIETIKGALLKRGIHVTIDGDMVIIEEAARTSAIRRRPAVKTSKEKENGGN